MPQQIIIGMQFVSLSHIPNVVRISTDPADPSGESTVIITGLTLINHCPLWQAEREKSQGLETKLSQMEMASTVGRTGGTIPESH